MTNTSTADYPMREETIIEEHRYTCPFAFNELVEVLDPQGRTTGQRGYFVAAEITLWNQLTGRAHVATIGGPNINVKFHQLRSVRH